MQMTKMKNACAVPLKFFSSGLNESTVSTERSVYFWKQ